MKNVIVASLLLGLLSVALKLFGAVTWPWWAVLLPFYAYITAYAVLGVLLIVVVVGLTCLFGLAGQDFISRLRTSLTRIDNERTTSRG